MTRILSQPLSALPAGRPSCPALTRSPRACSHSAPMGKIRKDRQELLPGTLDMLILKTLSRQVMHGYGIAEHIRQVSSDVLKVEEGSLYPALQRLEQKGMVRSYIGVPTAERGGRRRRHYLIDTPGEQALGRSFRAFRNLTNGLEKQLETL